MLRDTSGSNTYNGLLKNPLDPASEYWFDDPAYPGMVNQINNYEQYIKGNPNEVEGDKGIFIMTSSEFFNAFQSYQVAHDNK